MGVERRSAPGARTVRHGRSAGASPGPVDRELESLASAAGNRALARLIERAGGSRAHASQRPLLQRQAQGSATARPAASSTPGPAGAGRSVYRIRIVGHASPRWRHPGASTPARRNLALSERRALAVEEAVQALFAEAGRPVEYDLICEPAPDEGGSSLELDWRGQSETLEEAQGDLDANHPELRRVDLAVDVLESATVLAGQSTAVTLPATTTRWAVKVDFVTSGGEGVYASGGYAHLKNRDTGQVVRGAWIAGGGGAGVELPIPAVSPNPSWSNFETSSPVSFASFDGTAVRFTHVDVGIGIAGYSFAYLSFPFFMDEGVSVSGFVMNQWGLGGSVTSGVWSFEEPIPPPPTFAVEEAIPVETTVGTSFGHRVLFETGEEIVSDDELERLRAFVSALP